MTTIRWTDRTWNFIAGCSLKSAGCTNCYAARMALRLQHCFGIPHYKGTTSYKTRQFTGWVNLAPPPSWKRRRVGESQRCTS